MYCQLIKKALFLSSFNKNTQNIRVSVITFFARKQGTNKVQIHWEYLIKIGFVKAIVSVQKHNSGMNCDTILCYHRKIKPLIIWHYCRYNSFFRHLNVGDNPKINTNPFGIIAPWDQHFLRSYLTKVIISTGLVSISFKSYFFINCNWYGFAFWKT